MQHVFEMPTKSEIKSAVDSWKTWTPDYQPTLRDWSHWILWNRDPELQPTDPDVEFLMQHEHFKPYLESIGLPVR